MKGDFGNGRLGGRHLFQSGYDFVLFPEEVDQAENIMKQFTIIR